jgi:hypothetical protein
MKKTRILPSPHLEGPQVPSIQAAEDKGVKVVFPADLPKLDSRGHHAFRPRDPRLPQEMILKSWPKLVAWGDIIGFFFGERDEMMKWVRSNMSNKNPARAPWPLYGCQALGPTRIAVLKENSLGQGAMIHTLAVLCAHKTGIG